jgi:hypothetical protein
MELEDLVLDIQNNYFPELKGIAIEVVPKPKLSATMEVSPFSAKIRFNPERVEKCGEEELWATIGHELCHFLQFRRIGIFQKLALYLRVGILNNLDCLSRLEKEADLMAIDRGFGNALVKARRKADELSSAEVLAKRRKIYYSPTELEKLIGRVKRI